MKHKTYNQKSKEREKRSLFHVSCPMFQESGFTLIELLTSIAVIGIVSTVIFAKLNTSSQNLNRAAQRLALDIRRAQNLALAPATSTAPCLYGLRVLKNTFNTDNASYFIYFRNNCVDGPSENSNLSVNGHQYQNSNSSMIDNQINLNKLYKGVAFTTLTNNNSAQDIAFSAPEPITYLNGRKTDNDGNGATMSLQLTCGTTCGTKTITVNRFGMVEIQ